MSMWGFGSAEAIEQEQRDIKSFDAAVSAMVVASAPLARLGDGNCGHVLEKIKAGLTAAGLYTDSPKYKSAAKKQTISNALRTQVFERDMYRCLRCSTHINLRADHVIPESQGGPMDINNLQTLCQPCNSWKGTKTIDFRGGTP